MKIDLKSIEGDSTQLGNIEFTEGRLVFNQCNVTFEPGDFVSKEISIVGCIINVPKGSNIVDRNGTNLIKTPPAEVPRLCWIKCDKGWFGVSLENWAETEYAVHILIGHEEGLVLTKGTSLIDMMTWAVRNDVPYEISTVEPKMRDD